MTNLAAMLDYFLSDSLRNTPDENLRLRAMITAGITLMYCSSMAFVALLLSIVAYLDILVWWPATVSCALSAVCYFLQMIYLKKTGNLFVASVITMSILFLFTVWFIYITGGWNSPVILFLFIVPMCAFLITGHKQGAAWSVLSIMVYTAMGSLEYAGIATPQVSIAEYEKLFRFFVWMFSWFMIVGGVMLYSNIVNNLNASINHEKKKTRLRAMFDEESGAYTRKEFGKLLIKKIQTPAPQIKAFALVFMELTHETTGSAETPRHEILKKLFNQLKLELEDRVVVSRYGGLSMTALVSSTEEVEITRDMINVLYKKLQHIAGQHRATLYVGAVVGSLTHSDVHAMTNDARNALHHAKTQEEKLTVYLRGVKKKNDRDYMAEVIVGSYDQILNGYQSAPPAPGRGE